MGHQINAEKYIWDQAKVCVSEQSLIMIPFVDEVSLIIQFLMSQKDFHLDINEHSKQIL